MICQLRANLSLGIRSEPLAGSVVPEFGHSLVELVCEDDGEGHSLRRQVKEINIYKKIQYS